MIKYEVEIEKYVRRCKICQMNKSLGHRSRAPLEITITARRPFERCAVDIMGPTGVTDNGNIYILTFQANLTKLMAAIPIPTQDAETIAREFVQNVVLKHGIPEVILTDQGANFLSEPFTSVGNYCRLRKFKRRRFTSRQTVAYNGDTKFSLSISGITSQRTSKMGMNGWRTLRTCIA